MLKRLDIYIYIIYTPNLGLGIAVFDGEREQGRFRGSSEGARGSSEGAGGSSEGATREHHGAVQGRSRWEPKMASSYPAIAAHVIYNNILSPGSACYCLGSSNFPGR